VAESPQPDNSDDYYMGLAIEQARIAEAQGEVPVGAIIVKDDEVIATGGNAPITLHDPSAHAEMRAMRAAGESLQNYRLNDTTLYVTLEPCPMCAGALVNARVSRVVYGAQDFKAGAAGTVFELTQSDKLNHRLAVTGGVREGECVALLQEFFRGRR